MTGAAAPDNEPRGIGGWLILPAIAIGVSILVTLYGVFEISEALFGLPLNRAYLVGLLRFELLINSVLCLCWILAAGLMWAHKKAFPAFFIGLMLATIVVLAADLLIAKYQYDVAVAAADARPVGRAIFASAIWIPYMLISKRVRNTFVK